VFVSLTVAFSTESIAEDNVIDGCYHKKSGRLRIVNDFGECRKNELPISWNIVGQQGPPGIGSIQVYDADDQYLGILVSYGRPQAIYTPDLQTVTLIELDTGHIVFGDLTFESNDCTGIGYGDNDFMFRHPDGFGGNRYYKPILKTVTIIRNSYRRGSFEGICLGRPGDEYSCYNLVEISEEDIPFNLPVALPLRYESQKNRLQLRQGGAMC
jgi:hypothetical protein